MFRKAFTLMEVNLAIMVMAGGLLSSVALFALGYKESAQSNEDVATAAYAEAVIGRMVLALSATNVTWSSFNSIENTPSGLWGAYFNKTTGEVEGGSEGKAMSAFNAVMGAANGSGVPTGWPTKPDILGGVGMVVTHDKGSPLVKIAFRASRSEKQLMSSPVYYTEVLFQGRQ